MELPNDEEQHAASSCESSTQNLPVTENVKKPELGSYYSVFIPEDTKKDTQGSSCLFNFIYKDKVIAMKTMKRSKKARLKHFDDINDAFRFATSGRVKYIHPYYKAHTECDSALSLNSQLQNERLSLFKGPKPQDLVKLRKSIETGDFAYLKKMVWENPRFLISSGDTPSILQEGFRYNALHVAAKAKNSIAAEFVLSTISNPKFIQRLYGEDCSENIERRIEILLDLYLNTPDKGLNETPLHFASKFGAANVVEILVSFPQCDRTLKNKYDQTPDMVICDRCDNKNDLVQLKKKIAIHLENDYYVPVVRAEDNSLIPAIGEPFSPAKPPVLNSDPRSPRLEIHAYAGPLNKETAEQFRKAWKTPPRTSTPIKSRTDVDLNSVLSLRFTDPVKGLERLGQTLASKFDVLWKEYWPFLDCFVDISSEEGLILFEKYLTAHVDKLENSYNHQRNKAAEESVVLTKKHLSPVADLCLSLQKSKLSDSFEDSDFNAFLCVEKACNVFANRIACEIQNRVCDDFSVQLTVFELQSKQVEMLVISYMDDYRFNQVNFASFHHRVGLLTAMKLCYIVTKPRRAHVLKILNKFVKICIETYNCVSSDDEDYSKDNKPTPGKKQLICLMQNVCANLTDSLEAGQELQTEELCREAWNNTKECNCVFHFKKTRKPLGFIRNNLSKHRTTFKSETSRKLNFSNEASGKSTGESEDEFFTPPSSPINGESEDEYNDVPLLGEIFIESRNPSQTDCAVFKALKFANCQITPQQYPLVYRWYHNVGLYSDTERESWPPIAKFPDLEKIVPPRFENKRDQSGDVSQSWLRITGANSPKTSKKKSHC